MHPWAMAQWAEDRRGELVRAGAEARTVHEARHAGPGGAAVANRRATRYLGEFLIRTGWRLLGSEAPASGVRPRLALRAPGRMVDVG